MAGMATSWCACVKYHKLGIKHIMKNYIGETKDGKKHGQGTCTYANGDKYTGEFFCDKRNGQGTLTTVGPDKYTEYVGEWQNNYRQGFGIETDSTEIDGVFKKYHRYSGEWHEDVAHGQGTSIFSDGAKYVGEWRHSIQTGEGTYTAGTGQNSDGTDRRPIH